MDFVQATNLIDLYRIENFNDTFALGHYARVLDAVDRRNGQQIAFKVLRPEHMNFDGEPSWEYRAFAIEADLLMKMSQMTIGLPLAVVHPAPDGEAMIKRLVDNGQARVVDGQVLELTPEGRAQGQAIFASISDMVP